MISKRPDGAATRQILAKTIIKGLDTWTSIIVGIAVFIALLSARTIEGPTALIGMGTVSVAFLGYSVAMEKRLGELLRVTDYGEIVSAVDPDLRATLTPFTLIGCVSAAAIVASFVGFGVVGMLEIHWQIALMYAIPSWLTSWSLIGSLGLSRIMRFHIRGANRMANEKRRLKREVRDRERGEQ